MYFDPDTLDARNVYKLMTATVVPRPIAWVVSQDVRGQLNAAPFSFFNVMSGDPPVVALGIGSRQGRMKDTANNIKETGEFVVNLVSYSMCEAMNLTSLELDPDVDELSLAGLSTIASEKVKPPRIAHAPAALECKLLNIVDIGALRSITLATVVAIHVADEAVLDTERCYIDTPKLDLVGRMHGSSGYTRTTDRFEMNRPDMSLLDRLGKPV